MPRTRALRMYCACAIAIGIVSVALMCESLRGTLVADDWDHYAMQRHIYPVDVPAWDMFRFVGGTAAEKHALLDAGRLPWWASLDIHLAVFRPLSSLLVYADLAWFAGKDHPWWMHLHSLLWWCVLFGAVATLYRRFLPFPAAIISLLVFAVDDAHVFPVVWIANRSEVVSIALVCWGIWAHVTAETDPRPLRFRVAAAALVGLGLLAGEHAIAPLSYLAMFELARTRSRWPEAARRLLPYVVLTLAYSVGRAALGYGVSGSALYLDPIGEPNRYLHAAATRVPLLAADLVFGVPAEWGYWGNPYTDTIRSLFPEGWLEPKWLIELQLCLGVATLIAFALGLLWGYRISARSARSRERLALLLAAVLSLAPLAGTLPMARLTVAPAIAFDALIAWVIWWLVKRFAWIRRRDQRFVLGAAIAIIAFVHIARPATLCVEGTRAITDSSHLEYGWATKADFGHEDVTKRHVFIVSAHDAATQYLLPYVLDAAHLPAPLTTHLLSSASDNSHVLTRVAANVLDVQFPEPITDPVFVPMVYRQAGTAFFPGQTFHNNQFDVEVKMVRNRQPRQLRFTFHAPLDDPHYLFMYPTKHGIEPLNLPALGTSIRLDPPAWPQ